MSSEASGELPNGKNVSSEGQQNGYVTAAAPSRSNGSSSSYSSGGKASAAPECSAQDGNSTSYHTGKSSSASEGSASEGSTSDSESESEMSPEDALDALQRDPRTAQLLQWCRVFAEPLRLRPIGIEELVGCHCILAISHSTYFTYDLFGSFCNCLWAKTSSECM